MLQRPIAIIAALSGLFAFGCRPTQPTSVRIERFAEAEEVLAQVGLTSWVFKHQGGELTTEFIIYHSPAGKDQTPQVVFRAVGDDAVRVLHELSGDDARQAEEGGSIVVAFPNHLQRGGDLTHSFRLNGSSCYTRQSIAEVFPDTVDLGSSGGVNNAIVGPVELNAGESKAIVDVSMRLNTPGSDVPFLERELVHFVLTVTALKEGSLPKRDK